MDKVNEMRECQGMLEARIKLKIEECMQTFENYTGRRIGSIDVVIVDGEVEVKAMMEFDNA